MRKKLPIGIDGFEKIRKNDFYYADKTMFIAELLNNWGEVNLFTRPRRFGKSLNMSMLKAFFEIDCDKTLFEGLNILQEKELCDKYMGKFPVISVTLKGIDRLSYEEAIMALRDVMETEAMRFRFLLQSNCLTESEKDIFRSLIHTNQGNDMINHELLMTGLSKLSMLLAKHYNKKVIILIDEYDVPLDKAFQAGYYDKMVSLLRNLLGNALKSNNNLYFAVLTGCLRISKESIFTGLNNLKVHTITDSRYDEYFGFTDSDVKKLLEFYQLTEYAKTIKEWYDGYLFGDVSVYCPWDVINYCDALLAKPNAKPKNYWANTSGNAMVRRFVGKADRKTKNEIERLIAGESIIKSVNQELTYQELDSSIENLWSVLFTTGYLTQKGQVDSEEDMELYQLSIPNREIRSLFISQIQAWFQEDTRADSEKIERFCKAFAKGEAQIIETLLQDYLWKSISIRDTAVRMDTKENFYHGMLLGLLQYEHTWEVNSNVESGEGYCDISIKTPNRIGVVIELKYAHDGDLEKVCLDAISQIEDKKYDTVLKKEGMAQIVKYGISFYKKNCKVIMK